MAGRPAAPGGAETAVAAGVFLFLLGGAWDIAWHVEIGRDSFWIPPHLVLYSGVLTVLGACAAALVAAWRAHRPPRPSVVIAGLGAILALAAGPLDDFWHRLYGLDVTLLSPPHLLLLAGMALAALGALAGFAWRAARARPALRESLWPAPRLDARPWVRGETGELVAGGLLLALATAVVSEYDFDVSRYPAALHPILLVGLSALVLTTVVRTVGRAGGATLTAAVATGVRLLVQLELVALTGLRPQIPLLLVAAPVLDLALWHLSLILDEGPGTARWMPAPLAGAAYGAALLLVQWPYTVAAQGVVWGPGVLAVAVFPALLAGAAGATMGWGLGAALRPLGPAATVLPMAPARSPVPAAGRGPGTGGLWGPVVAIALALAGLVLVAVVPAVRQHGAPPAPLAAGRQNVVGTLQLTPAAPVAGQPVTVRLTITDPFLITAPVSLPFESPRLGDLSRGLLRASSQPGVYEGTFTPREAGRRWLAVFFPVEEVRSAATAFFVVYPPGVTPDPAPPQSFSVDLRPEPGPDTSLPAGLQVLAYLLLVVLLAGAAAGVTFAIRREHAAAAPSPTRPGTGSGAGQRGPGRRRPPR